MMRKIIILITIVAIDVYDEHCSLCAYKNILLAWGNQFTITQSDFLLCKMKRLTKSFDNMI